MAKVLVKMGLCEMTHVITVTKNNNGTMNVSVESPCAQVRQYIQSLGTISEADLMDRKTSRIFDPELCKPLTLTCLIPEGVMHAAYLESGMLAKSLALRSEPDSISFQNE